MILIYLVKYLLGPSFPYNHQLREEGRELFILWLYLNGIDYNGINWLEQVLISWMEFIGTLEEP